MWIILHNISCRLHPSWLTSMYLSVDSLSRTKAMLTSSACNNKLLLVCLTKNGEPDESSVLCVIVYGCSVESPLGLFEIADCASYHRYGPLVSF